MRYTINKDLLRSDTMPEKIMLVDGNSIINRAFYALPALTNKNGEYTNGIFGFLNIIIKLFEEENPDYLGVAFDLPGKTFRHEQFDEYKGTRKAMPMELRPQIPMLKELLKKMNIPVYELEGYEADDILGSLAKSSQKNGLETVLVSGDRDLLQIASEDIKIRIPKTKGGKTEVEDYYEKDVMEKYGVTPKEFIDVKALMGDSSDNIPGVPGIGEKTALKIIQEYKSLENAYENIASLKPKKASENMLEFKEQAFMSKFLAEINTELNLSLPEEKCQYENIFNPEALSEMERLEFKSLIKKFDKREAPKPEDPSKLNFTFIKEKGQTDSLLKAMEKARTCALSFIEIDGLCLGASFYFEEEGGFFIEFNEELTLKEFLSETKFFYDSQCEIITLDSKNTIVLLYKNGIAIENIIFDAILGGYILNASISSYTYDYIGEKYLNERFPSLEDLIGKGKSKLDFRTLDDNTKLLYGCRQSYTAFKAFPIMKALLKENQQEELYYEIELPTARVLAFIEIYGIKVDKNALIDFDKLLTEDINKLTEEIYEMTGEVFNINSPSQLGNILFGKLGIKGGKRTKTGYSTAVDVLEPLRFDYPVVEKILNYRTLSKLKSTYCDGLLAVMDKETEKIYSTFNQTVTATGRLSSTEPNLQNIPIRTEIGRELRKVFIPSSDEYILVDADYSQIELRILAHISEDEAMIKAYRTGEDIHRFTASQVLHKAPEDVTSFERNSAKAVNFGIVYGIGAYSLSQDLGISVKEADDYISAYFSKYPKVKAYMDRTIADAKKNGYAKTMFGRRREIPEISSSNFNTRSFGERVAMNMPIQGSAADIIKIAMVKVFNRLKKENLASRIILQVHDELLLEVKKDEKEIVEKLLKEEMENAVKLLVPLVADVHSGETWFDAK
jgi:DNA polymerase-1